MREWIDIQADVFAMSEEIEPGAAERQLNLEAARERVRVMREGDGDS